MPINRKSTRLPLAHYLGNKSYFITVCCDFRLPHLANPSTAVNVIDTLVDSISKRPFFLDAYCAMPDHIHFLVRGTATDSNLPELLKLFKSRTSYDFRRLCNKRLWEMSFYDHILRYSDASEDVACYIWNNPVRKNLCASPEQYPYSGPRTSDGLLHGTSDRILMRPWKPPWPV